MSTEQQIKAKETYYNGYRFRSRSEARWAVFFDHAKIKYFYEPEGFTVKGTKGYLPDFYLPESKEFFEVKGVLDDEDLQKIESFMEETNLPVAVGYSDMTFQAPGKYQHYCLEDKDFSYLCYCSVCGKPFFLGYGGAWDCTACGSWDKYHIYEVCGENPFSQAVGYACMQEDNDFILAAFTKARQARFEHGEKG